MNPVLTALLAVMFLAESLTVMRVVALVLGVAAVLAACAGRLSPASRRYPSRSAAWTPRCGCLSPHSWSSPRAASINSGSCADIDFRVTATPQNAVCLGPVTVLASLALLTVRTLWHAAAAVAAVVLLNATLCMTMYVRAISVYRAATVSMLFCVIPAVAGLLAWVMLGQRPDVGIGVGLVLGAVACWRNASAREQRQHDPAGNGRG